VSRIDLVCPADNVWGILAQGVTLHRMKMKPLIEIRDMDRDDEYFVGTCTHIDESTEIDTCAERRLRWLRSMHERGLRVKVATLDGVRTGFLYAIPIESSPWGPLGHGLLVIPCLYVQSKSHGVGRALLAAAEEEAKRQGLKGIVTIGYRHDFWFMPARFFDANGFLECAQHAWGDPGRDDRAVLLWKTFGEHAEAPTPLKPRYEFRAMPGSIVVDLFWNTFCQTSVIEAQCVREVAAEFGDHVALREYCADDREILLRHQIPRGIFINGREIGWGYEAPKQAVREAIVQALQREQGRGS
jgi:GNAT superfamily N-acetyltransferase